MELEIVGKLQKGPMLAKYGERAYLIYLLDRSCTSISNQEHRSYYNSGVFMLTTETELSTTRKIWEVEKERLIS